MNLGEVCPGTYQKRYYRLQSDGTDSSGNAGTLSNLNSVAFTNQGRFGAGADFGSSAATKALYSTTYPFSANDPTTGVSIGFWIKLNNTTDVTLRRCFDINPTGTTVGIRIIGGYRISGGALIFQGFLQGDPTAGFVGNISVEINAGTANTTSWYYVLVRELYTSATNRTIALNVNGSDTATTVGNPFSPVCQLNPTYRLVVGNGTNSTAVQVLAVIDEVIIIENNILTQILPQRQYYTQAKGMFCI